MNFKKIIYYELDKAASFTFGDETDTPWLAGDE